MAYYYKQKCVHCKKFYVITQMKPWGLYNNEKICKDCYTKAKKDKSSK